MAARDPLAGVDWAATFGKIAHDVRNPLATISNSAYYITSRLSGFFNPRALATRRLGLNSWLESVLKEATLPESVAVRQSLAAQEPVTLADPEQLKAVPS